MSAELRQALWAERLRRSFSRFFREAWKVHEPATPLLWSWPYDVVCEHLQTLVRDWHARQSNPQHVQRIQNLLCTLPPGTAKSRITAALISWAWTFAPSMRAIALSANPRVALRDSVIARDIIASDWYQRTFRPSWQVRQDTDAKGLFANTAGGWRAAMGFDARIVGERGDLIIVDDPHDPEEAASDVQRDHVHERWDLSIWNRVNDLGTSIRCGIAQRTHEDDWSSRRIAEGWTHVDLPMEYEPDRECVTPLGRVDRRTVEGECLHAERFPPEVVAKEKEKGAIRWATLYQGRPAPAGGALVKLSTLRYWRLTGKPDATAARARGAWQGPSIEIDPDHFAGSVTIAADLAMGKQTKAGDYNAIVALGRKGSSFYVLAVEKFRGDFPEVQRRFRAMAARWPGARKVVERAAAGASLETSLRDEIPGLYSVPPGNTSKVQRLQSVLAYFDAGNVHLDEHSPLLDELVSELITVPNARHDDFTDALVLALAQSVQQARISRPSVGALTGGGSDSPRPSSSVSIGTSPYAMTGGSGGDHVRCSGCARCGGPRSMGFGGKRGRW